MAKLSFMSESKIKSFSDLQIPRVFSIHRSSLKRLPKHLLRQEEKRTQRDEMGAKTECPNGEEYIGRLTGEHKLGPEVT